jgi:drug/metabolite transporter (DMT)-like permease
VLWLSALKNTNNTARISNLIFASPFISLILLSTIIGEEIHPTTLFGLVLIIAGLVVQQVKRKHKKLAAEKA